MDIQKLSEETNLKIENLKSQIDILEEELPLFPITLLKLGVFLLSAVVAVAIPVVLMGQTYNGYFRYFSLFIGSFVYYSCLKNIRVFKKHSKLKALQSQIKQLEEQLGREIHKANIKKWRDKRNKTLQK